LGGALKNLRTLVPVPNGSTINITYTIQLVKHFCPILIKL